MFLFGGKIKCGYENFMLVVSREWKSSLDVISNALFKFRVRCRGEGERI